ncbi:hypothetical protein JCM8547_008728 [Rhodosporidiobolus lusitaniae]
MEQSLWRSTWRRQPRVRQLIIQGKLSSPMFSFKLSSTSVGPSELFMGGMNPAYYVAGSTQWASVNSAAYWSVAGTPRVNGVVPSGLGNYNMIIDTGTTLIVAPPAFATAFWAAVPNSQAFSAGYYIFSSPWHGRRRAMFSLSRLKPLLPTTPATIAFLSVTIFETLVDGVLVAILLNSFEDKIWKAVLARDEKSVLPVYLGLFVLAHVFQLVLAVDALVAKNTIQVLALLVFNTLFMVYALVQIHEVRNLVTGHVLRVLVWFIPGMISLTEITYLATIWFIYNEFGWQVFKRIGADRRIKKSYAWYQVFLCILKFDMFFFLAFSLQLVFLVPTQTNAERWLTVAALPVTLVILLLGYFAVKREHKGMFWGFMAGCALGTAYFIYKLFIIYRDRERDYRLVFKSLTVFAALCLAALLWTTTTSYICYRHFGRGLKYHMGKGHSYLGSSSHLELKSTEDGETGYVLEDTGPNSRNRYRMSID